METSDHDLLIKIDTMMFSMQADLKRLGEDVKTKNDDHETRIRKVERGQWVALGGGSVLGTIGGYLMNWLTIHH